MLLINREFEWALSSSVPTPTHPHSPPATQNNAPLTPTYPYLSKIMLHTPPPTQNNVSPTQINPHSLKIMPNCHSHKIWSNNLHLLNLLFDHKVK